MKTASLILNLLSEEPDQSCEWVMVAMQIFKSADCRISDSYPGVCNATDELATLRVRAVTTQKGNIKAVGLAEIIVRLQTLPPEKRLLSFGILWREYSLLAYLMVDAAEVHLVGCVAVKNQNG